MNDHFYTGKGIVYTKPAGMNRRTIKYFEGTYRGSDPKLQGAEAEIIWDKNSKHCYYAVDSVTWKESTPNQWDIVEPFNDNIPF